MTKIRNKRKLRIFDVINACIMILLGFSFVVPFWIIACSSLSDNGQLMSCLLYTSRARENVFYFAGAAAGAKTSLSQPRNGYKRQAYG